MKIEKRTKFPSLPKRLRVAAYARVSIEKDAMLHSLSAQVSKYNAMFLNHPEWEFCGVYADAFITGTKEERPEFQKLLAECRAGKVDLIITKSVSRFARNTLTILEIVRELKQRGIAIYFEEQNINTLSADGELMITVFASFAQEEARSMSENRKWRIRKDYQMGIPNTLSVFGYQVQKDQFIIVPEEAEIVREIFSLYLSGIGMYAIVRTLNGKGLKTKAGKKWTKQAVKEVLQNEKYAGDLLLQKKFITDPITKVQKKNHGELPQYYVTDNHEPIIDHETFEAVQAEIKRRAGLYAYPKTSTEKIPFAGKLRCGVCGEPLRRRMAPTSNNGRIPIWICSAYSSQGKAVCKSRRIREDILEEAVDGLDYESISVFPDNKLLVRLYDGMEIAVPYRERSRSESWTEKMKEAARERVLA